MKKIFLLLFLGIFLINNIYAFDSQNSYICGGDEQLQMRCFGGDEQNSFFGNIPIVNGHMPHLISSGRFPYVLAIVIILLCALFLLIVIWRDKREKNKKY